jgi:protein-disulfide isomerase
MSSAKKKVVSEPQLEEEIPVVRSQKSASIRFPRFSLPTTITNTHILVAILIVFSFALGYLFNQVRSLEQTAKNQTGEIAGTQTGTQQNQAVAPSVAPQKVNVDNGHFPIKGNTGAKVQIVEFADLRCPFCKQFFDQVESQLITDYVDTGKATFAFRSYAFLGPASTLAANAAECANDQGKFWEFHDYMYKNQPDETDTSMFTNDSLTSIAGQLGMDTTQFSDCLTNTKDSKNLSEDMSAASAAGVTGTPTLFINGTPVVGAQPYSAFKAAIDAALQG